MPLFFDLPIPDKTPKFPDGGLATPFPDPPPRSAAPDCSRRRYSGRERIRSQRVSGFVYCYWKLEQ